ncbi:AAA-ATPase-like protein [Candidatus Magnetomorum sp. HK-1]|nr:AAA-ATPase-like protein [Candidatus Magnetomorum sp. HK-1]
MKNPYDISNFESIRLEGYEYIDRTSRIPLTENVGKYLLFFRPRRFGKSLWLSTLKNYYNIAKADSLYRVGKWKKILFMFMSNEFYKKWALR